MSETPAYEFVIQVHLDEAPVLPEARIRAVVTWLLRRHTRAPGTGVSLVVAGDAEVAALNRQFRDIDAPTDVLSFPAEADPVPEDVMLEADEAGEYLGDLIVSLAYIRRQAAEEQHAVDDELLLTVIHGTLHLLGYDHDTPANQDAMWAIQAEALAAMGIEITVPRFEFPDDDESPGE